MRRGNAGPDNVRLPDPTFWRGKRVLLTGHTGFKGAWMSLWLAEMGAQVIGVALPPTSAPNLFGLAGVVPRGESHMHDIRDATGVSSLVSSARPDIVFHLAAQPLVRPSYRDPLATFDVNVMGTAHVLDALRAVDCVRVAVMITTDKVYRNADQGVPFQEDDALGGYDPYSASKAAAEIVISSYRSSFLKESGVAVASARAGNVIGGGDWAEDRLLPDAVRAWQAGVPLEVRRPDATRPWQHVLEPLAGYMMLAETLWQRPGLADAYNFGPVTTDALKVRAVVECACKAYGSGEFKLCDGNEGPHEAHMLALSIDKVSDVLGFAPRWTAEEAIRRAMRWYRAQADGAAALDLCRSDIAAYQAVA
jgi:CDP-glucose 4,6-dehydratase